MRNRRGGPSPVQSELTGNDAVERIRHELKSIDLTGFLPEHSIRRFHMMLKRITVFDDPGFHAFVVGRHVLAGVPAAEEQMRAESATMNAAYIYHDASSQGPAIGIRKRVTQNHLAANLSPLICEELAHSLASVQSTPVHEGNTVPFVGGTAVTKSTLIEAINTNLESFGVESSLSKDTPLQMVRSGWKTYLTDPETGLHYPWGTAEEIVDEETRAAVVQTALLAAAQGSGRTSLDRFLDGMAKIRIRLNKEIAQGFVSIRFMAGVMVLGAFGNDAGWRQSALKDFFHDLCSMDKKSFIRKHPSLRQALGGACEYIADEMNIRQKVSS